MEIFKFVFSGSVVLSEEEIWPDGPPRPETQGKVTHQDVMDSLRQGGNGTLLSAVRDWGLDQHLVLSVLETEKGSIFDRVLKRLHLKYREVYNKIPRPKDIPNKGSRWRASGLFGG